MFHLDLMVDNAYRHIQCMNFSIAHHVQYMYSNIVWHWVRCIYIHQMAPSLTWMLPFDWLSASILKTVFKFCVPIQRIPWTQEGEIWTSENYI